MGQHIACKTDYNDIKKFDIYLKYDLNIKMAITLEEKSMWLL